MERNWDLIGNVCTNCKRRLDAARLADGTPAKPSENDLCVCGYCGTIWAFDASLKLTAATEKQIDALGADKARLMKISQDIKRHMKL